MARKIDRPSRNGDGKTELVLGGGGIKGFGLIGGLKALEEKKVDLGTITGISIGSVVAAFYVNGYTPGQIQRIFLTELMGLDPDSLKRTMRLPTILRLWHGGFIDLGGLFREIVEKYELKPKRNLRILAYNVLQRKPVVFEGTDYDLARAITASCSIPGIMRPVWHGQGGIIGTWLTLVGSLLGFTSEGILVDGGVHHPNPGEFCQGRAIILKLGFASRLPDELLSPIDLGFHLLEMFWSVALDWHFQDPSEHILIKAGLPDVACLSFGLSPEKCQAMVDFGYNQTARAIDRAIARGAVPVKKPRGDQK